MENDMKRLATCFGLLIILLATACGGGGEDDAPGFITDNGPGSNLVAGFDAADPAPDSLSVTLQEGTTTGNIVTIDAVVTDTNDVYGASFDLRYDPARATFQGSSAGNLLEDGGRHTPVYQVGEPTRGHVVVGASRQGDVGTVNAVGERTLIRLTFSVTAAGSSAVGVENGSLFDGQTPPLDLPDMSWAGGTLRGV